MVRTYKNYGFSSQRWNLGTAEPGQGKRVEARALGFEGRMEFAEVHAEGVRNTVCDI